MASAEDCKRSLEVTVPADVVKGETERVAQEFQKKARLQGFRPGKAPLSMIRKAFNADINQRVLENLIPKLLDQRFEEEHLKVVSRPDITDVKFEEGQPLVFKAEFEIAPEFELGEYRGLEVPYAEPAVTPEEIDARVEEMREGKASFVNIDPRPLENGDFAVLSLESTSGVDDPVKSDEISLELGGKETLPAFTDALLGVTPGEERDIEVSYPEDYVPEKLAGRTVAFHIVVKGVRRKELPEVNEDFAKEMGDFRSVDELREAVRGMFLAQKELAAQQAAKNLLVDKLVSTHDFALPSAYIDRQIENRTNQRLQELKQEGVDISSFKPDWEKLREAQGESARREVSASLLLGKVAERESIHATQDEVTRQIEQIARQQRQSVPLTRKRLEENGGIDRIANHIVTEKTLALLFENARKVEPQPPGVPTEQEPATAS